MDLACVESVCLCSWLVAASPEADVHVVGPGLQEGSAGTLQYKGLNDNGHPVGKAMFRGW